MPLLPVEIENKLEEVARWIGIQVEECSGYPKEQARLRESSEVVSGKKGTSTISKNACQWTTTIGDCEQSSWWWWLVFGVCVYLLTVFLEKANLSWAGFAIFLYSRNVKLWGWADASLSCRAFCRCRLVLSSCGAPILQTVCWKDSSWSLKASSWSHNTVWTLAWKEGGDSRAGNAGAYKGTLGRWS